MMALVTQIPKDIPELTDIVDVTAITAGWSSDRKFRVTSYSGNTWMLRLSDARLRSKKLFEYECICRAAQTAVLTPKPVAFGECDDGRQNYMLLTWVEGHDLQDTLSTISDTQQRDLGLKAGRLLRTLQEIFPISSPRTWDQIFLNQQEKRVYGLAETGITLPERDAFLACIERHRHLLEDRPMSFAHGDYHVGNMIVTPDGDLAVIDFDRCKTADPWDDHKRILWDVETSPAFASGRLDGYFEGAAPDEFWALLKMYCASNAIGSIAWAVSFGEEQIEHHLRQARELFESYGGMENTIPNWYTPSDAAALINHGGQ